MITVRGAGRGDCPLLMETTRTLAQFHDNEAAFKATVEKFEAALFGPHPIIGALVAEVDGVPAGSVVWHRSFSTNLCEEIMYMEDISVLPEARSRGVGMALMRATARLAVEKGYAAIYWLVMPWNDKAKQFYLKCGAVAEEDHTLFRLKGDALQALAR